jgi:hypothetical protein
MCAFDSSDVELVYPENTDTLTENKVCTLIRLQKNYEKCKKKPHSRREEFIG